MLKTGKKARLGVYLVFIDIKSYSDLLGITVFAVTTICGSFRLVPNGYIRILVFIWCSKMLFPLPYLLHVGIHHITYCLRQRRSLCYYSLILLSQKFHVEI